MGKSMKFDDFRRNARATSHSVDRASHVGFKRHLKICRLSKSNQNGTFSLRMKAVYMKISLKTGIFFQFTVLELLFIGSTGHCHYKKSKEDVNTHQW